MDEAHKEEDHMKNISKIVGLDTVKNNTEMHQGKTEVREDGEEQKDDDFIQRLSSGA